MRIITFNGRRRQGDGARRSLAVRELPAAANGPQHPMHERAVELAPRRYHSVRLHSGVVPGGLLGNADLVLERTRYYDYDSQPTWLAVRELASPPEAPEIEPA